MAAAKLGWGGVARGGGSSARGGGSRGSRRFRVERWAKQEVACGLCGGGRRGTVPADRGSRKGGRRLKKLDFFVNSKKIRGPTVKLKYFLN